MTNTGNTWCNTCREWPTTWEVGRWSGLWGQEILWCKDGSEWNGVTGSSQSLNSMTNLGNRWCNIYREWQVVVLFIEQGVEATQTEICHNQLQVKMSVLQHNLTAEAPELHTTCDSILATDCCQVSKRSLWFKHLGNIWFVVLDKENIPFGAKWTLWNQGSVLKE